jgi:hypothetical protein
VYYTVHVNDKEEGMENDRGRYGATMHGSTLTTLNVLITLWALICVSNFLLYFKRLNVKSNENVKNHLQTLKPSLRLLVSRTK